MARWLSLKNYPVQQQNLNNWSRRGVPKDACLELGNLLGVSPIWLFYGDQPPAKATALNQELAHYGDRPTTPQESRLLQAFRLGSDETRAVLLSIADTILKGQSDFMTRTGTQ